MPIQRKISDNMKKFLLVFTFLGLSINAFANVSNAIELVAKIRIAPPKVFAKQYLELINNAKIDQQTKASHEIIAILLGYPKFQGVSEKESINFTVLRHSNELKTFVEISADEKSLLIANLKNFVKFQKHKNRMLATFPKNAEKSLINNIDVDESQMDSWLKAKIFSPDLILTLFPNLKISSDTLKKCKDIDVDITCTPVGLLAKLRLNMYAQEQNKLTHNGFNLIDFLPKCNTLISSNISLDKKIEIALHTSNGNAILHSNANCAISIQENLSKESNLNAIIVGKIKGEKNKFKESEIYKISADTLLNAPVYKGLPTNFSFKIFKDFVVFSTDEANLENIVTLLKSKNSKVSKSKNIFIEYNKNNEKFKAEILFSQKSINAEVLIPNKIAVGLILLLSKAYTQIQAGGIAQ